MFSTIVLAVFVVGIVIAIKVILKKADRKSDEFANQLIASFEKLELPDGPRKIVKAYLRIDCLPWLVVQGFRFRERGEIVRQGISIRLFDLPKPNWNPVVDILESCLRRDIYIDADDEKLYGRLSGIVRPDEYDLVGVGMIDEISLCEEVKHGYFCPWSVERILVFGERKVAE